MDENKFQVKALVADADKIEYPHHGPTVAPQYNRGSTITITPNKLVVDIKSYSKVLLTEYRPFTQEKFNEVLSSFKDLKGMAKPSEDEMPVGGSLGTIAFYKDGKEIFKGYHSGNKAINYTGADIDLSYLAPGLNELIE
jgi:hypothetical protein